MSETDELAMAGGGKGKMARGILDRKVEGGEYSDAEMEEAGGMSDD